jgi:hypothetical protein
MTEKLQHDPRTKQQIKDILFDYLYGPGEASFKKQLAQIVSQNCVLTNSAHKCFSYRGVVYSIDAPPVIRKMTRLHPTLHMKMDKYVKETKQLNNHELPYVLGFINQVLNSSNNLQDYLKLLPDSVHSPIQVLINSCPCRVVDLSADEIKHLKEKNYESIELIKQRMLSNLIL